MIAILIYYVILPILAGALVIRFIKKYGRHEPAEDVRRLLADSPLEKRFYRAARRDAAGLAALGDFEKHEEAVDRIYEAREQAQKTGLKAAFLVLNDAGETLDLIEA